MIIAVSTAFADDFAEFICFKVESGEICCRDVNRRAPGGAEELAAQLVALEVDLLIAGDLSKTTEKALSDAGVYFISGKDGLPDALAAAYLNGTLDF